MSTGEPRIYLISRPTIDDNEINRFLSDRDLTWKKSTDASAAENIIEVCGRVCYLSFKADISKIRYPNRNYIANLIDQKHDSVLEHAVWTFVIDGVSRSFTHQLVRHRVGFSFSQLSQQYHDESDAEFVAPEGLKDHPELLSEWNKYMSTARDSYRFFLKKLTKLANTDDREILRRVRSSARSLLPNATATTIAVTANARALRTFFSARGAIVGDIEMRRVACELYRLVCADSPSIFTGFSIENHEDGWPILLQAGVTGTHHPFS